MGDPGSVVAVSCFPALIFAHFLKCRFIRGRVALYRYICGHATHGEGTAFMTGLDTGERISAHEGGGHSDLREVRNDEALIPCKFLDVTEQVIAAVIIQACP